MVLRLQKMPKRKCVCTDNLKEEYKFLKQCQNSYDRVRCSTYNSEFSVGHRGRYDIENHMQSDRHKRLIKRCPKQVLNLFLNTLTPQMTNYSVRPKKQFLLTTLPHTD